MKRCCSPPTWRPLVFGIWAIAWAACGCNGSADWLGGDVPGNLRVSSLDSEGVAKEATNPNWAELPVPPADGPQLAPLALSVEVRQIPDPQSSVIGALRVGARIARSAHPVSHRNCPEGWYALNPVGFVCIDEDVTIRMDHPIARAIRVEPERRWPMPYRYGFIRAIAPNYLRVPSREEQLRYEMRLERHLRSWQKLGESWDALDVGANDVPLDPQGIARGKIPEHAVPLGMSERYGGNGDDRIPWWLVNERRIPNLSTFQAPSYAVIADRIKRHAGVAMIGTFVATDKELERRFAITADTRLIPADKIKASSGSPFHGEDIRDLGLPVAFAAADDGKYYTLDQGLRAQESMTKREFIPLSGSVKILRGQRYAGTRDGRWVRSSELRTIAKPNTLPPFARHARRWIDISIVNQSLVLWEGERPVYATLVSTGRDGLGEPGKTLSTPLGQYRIYQKHVTATMDSDVADNEFELRDVPWVMYFKGGYALHAAYWHGDFGHARSHGCVNLSPIDARLVFFWSSPEVPPHWHSVMAGEPFEDGTIVNIHP